MRRPALEGAAGQASIELVALLPLIVTVAFGVAQVLAAGAAGEAAAGPRRPGLSRSAGCEAARRRTRRPARVGSSA
jgi:hypothetical protein